MCIRDRFEGQTKAKLGNSEIRTLVDGIVSDRLMQFLEENPVVARTILDLSLIHISPADTVRMELNTGISPAIIVPVEGEENFLYMVLPVRLKAN